MDNTQSAVLLETKLHRPRVPRNFIARPRLYNMLDRGLDHPLTLVCAAAGFGKTTLVSAWIESHKQQGSSTSLPNVAWLSLEESESDLDQFIRYFIGAVRTVIPDACAETWGTLEQSVNASNSLLGVLLANDLAQLRQQVTIVLDDCHLIGGTDVYELLSALLEHPPESVNLILISRFVPPLPLPKLRARGKVVDISNQDMRFTGDEVHAYADIASPHPLNQRNLETLELQLEGWIAGLQLVTLSLQDVEDIDAYLASFDGPPVRIFEFLLHEVLTKLPSAVKSFLLMTANLEQLSVKLCEHIIPHDDPDWDTDAIVDYVVNANLFITRLDVQGHWYRYHPMFRDVLKRAAADAISQEHAQAISIRVAYWYESQGSIDQAVKYALHADDIELAAQVMERGLPGVLNREDKSTLERWLRSLPADVVESRPGLLVIKAFTAHWDWQLDLFFNLIRKLDEYLEPTGQDGIEQNSDPHLYTHFTALKCMEAVYSGNPEQAVALGRQVLAIAPPEWTFVRGGIFNYLAVAMQIVGRGHEFEQEIWLNYENREPKTDAYAMRLLLSLCFINAQTGRLANVERVGKLLLDRLALQDLPLIEGWTHLYLGIAAYQTNHLDKAELHFSEPIAHSYRTSSMIVRECIAGLVSVRLAKGQYTEAAELVEVLARSDLEQRSHFGSVAQSVAARALLAGGEIGVAQIWGERCLDLPLRLIQMAFMELPQLSGIRTVLAGGTTADAQRARRLVDKLYAYAVKTCNTRRMIEATALRALILDRLNDAAAAEADLLHAVELAQEGTFLRPFVDLGPRMYDLLAALIVPAPLSGFLARILAAFPEHMSNHGLEPSPVDRPPSLNVNASSRRPVERMIEPLTPRETQVVRLLCEPLGIKEIARMLDVSYATAKRHSINIYGKLGVNSRWDAVKKAKDLGIIPQLDRDLH